MELMIALSGQAGEANLRGRVRGALARPASLRLEGLAPFGAPRFILVAHPDAAVLVLPRARRVVSEASAAELLDALAGVALGPADFGAVLTGCLMPNPQPHAARTYGRRWIGVDLDGGATLYLRTINGAPVIAAGTRDGLSWSISTTPEGFHVESACNRPTRITPTPTSRRSCRRSTSTPSCTPRRSSRTFVRTTSP